MVGGEGWTCLEAKKVLGNEIGGMRVGGGRLEMVGAEKGGRIRGLEKKNKKLLQGTRLEEGGLEVVGVPQTYPERTSNVPPLHFFENRLKSLNVPSTYLKRTSNVPLNVPQTYFKRTSEVAQTYLVCIF